MSNLEQIGGQTTFKVSNEWHGLRPIVVWKYSEEEEIDDFAIRWSTK